MLKKWSKYIVSAARMIGCFRKPVFKEFHCIDLVAGNRLLFLVSWEIAYAHKLSIHPGRHRYKKTAGAAVVGLLPGTEKVDIVISNCWRKTVLNIPLRHIALDSEILEMLDQSLLSPRIALNIGMPPVFNDITIVPTAIPDFIPFHFHTDFNPQFDYNKFQQDEP